MTLTFGVIWADMLICFQSTIAGRGVSPSVSDALVIFYLEQFKISQISENFKKPDTLHSIGHGDTA